MGTFIQYISKDWEGKEAIVASSVGLFFSIYGLTAWGHSKSDEMYWNPFRNIEEIFATVGLMYSLVEFYKTIYNENDNVAWSTIAQIFN